MTTAAPLISNTTKGVFAIVAACTIWGLSPLYYKLIAHVPPLEVLGHRTLWSLVMFGVVLALQRRLALVPRVLSGRGVWVVLFAAIMISANWFLFIYSVQAGRTVEASLGYYIFPLVAVVIGMLAFGERLGRLQQTAVALAALGVGLLTWGLGAAPWIALALAITFGLYGLVKKRIAAGPVISVAAEVTLLAPLAVVWLWGVHATEGGAFGQGWRDSLLLAVSGAMTAGPLILFSYATKRVRMATLGLVQYINPTLQFGCATLVFAEPFTVWHMVAFALIWAALAIYSVASIRSDKPVSSVTTSLTTVR